MPGLYPDSSTLYNARLPTSPIYKPAAPVEHPQKRPIFSSWSAADTVKNEAQKVASDAAATYEKASNKAQAKVGGIELYSGKYYAACTFGGIIACVGILNGLRPATDSPRASLTQLSHPSI
jgi:solute carrier family 25 (mitochondrial phosphate transporter), member 3